MNKKVVPQDFTLSLALFDFLPVLFFGGTIILVGLMFSSKLFLLGAFLCLFAGLSKVIWKMIVVLKKKNVWFLFVQMRITMPIGFLLMIISLFLNKDRININAVLSNVLSMPSIVFYIIGLIGMLLMLVFGFMLDGSKQKNNWIEQVTNTIEQACVFIGTLIIYIK